MTTVQAAQAAIERYSADGPIMSDSRLGIEEMNDHGPLSPGLTPMVVIIEWFPTGWDIILGWSLEPIVNNLFLLLVTFKSYRCGEGFSGTANYKIDEGWKRIKSNYIIRIRYEI